MGKVRDRFGGMGRFKGGLRCKGWVNSVIIKGTIKIKSNTTTNKQTNNSLCIFEKSTKL